MTEDRKVRRRWLKGHRRPRVFMLGAFAVLAACAAAPLANGASGGSGLAASTHQTHKRTGPHKASDNPFGGRGMWIWVLSRSSGGTAAGIIATARRYGITTVMIKSGDGPGYWSQFSSGLVSALHAGGLRVCGWQYVYGNQPGAEAQIGAAAVRNGADCLLIDAESEYEGKYVSAQTYTTTLRRLIGPSFPVALAGFPYIDYHPAFPYSVFLGPGGAQYNVPQMYWFDIGTSVDAVYAHTYVFNRIYQRPISPLGQVYNSPPARDIRRFRQASRAYAALGVSWWDWQESSGTAWHALSQPIGALRSFTPDSSYASIGLHATGDVVVWAQEHLVSAGDPVAIDGSFGPKTKSAVIRFQAAHGLPPIGLIGPATWQALLRYAPAAVHWTRSGAHTASARTASIASAGGVPVPQSASLPAKAYEIGRSHGRG